LKGAPVTRIALLQQELAAKKPVDFAGWKTLTNTETE
jgi:hypothetical protein